MVRSLRSTDVDAWLVDLDGTLYASLPVKLAMGIEIALLGRRSIATIRTFRREHELLRLGEPADAGDPFARQIRAAARALSADDAEVELRVVEWMIERPGKWLRRFRRDWFLDEIRRFREGGGRTAIVSDYPARAKLQALGASTLFDTVIASGEPGGPSRLKPHPDGYLLAARKLGVEPARCLVVGDRVDADGAAAAAAGMGFRRIR